MTTKNIQIHIERLRPGIAAAVLEANGISGGARRAATPAESARATVELARKLGLVA